jgi:hypothetical protein
MEIEMWWFCMKAKVFKSITFINNMDCDKNGVEMAWMRKF